MRMNKLLRYRVSVQDKLNVWANIHFRSPEMSISAGICRILTMHVFLFVCLFLMLPSMNFWLILLNNFLTLPLGII